MNYDDLDDSDIDEEECGMCGGDGWRERYDEDPLWYGHDLWPCDWCGGTGKVR
jgi:hypothetical protein